MNISKIFRPFLKPTAEAKIPTDLKLDYEIDYVSDILHHLSPILKRIVFTKIKLFFLYRWKYILGRTVVIGAIATLSILLITTVTSVKITTRNKTTDTILVGYRNDSTMNLRNFLQQISYGEANNNPVAHRDSSQYWGLYQLGADARRTGGFGDVPMYVFLRHPEIQDLCMVNLLKYEKKQLQSYIDKYSGKIVDGILITESGILALAHNGVGYAKGCLDRGIIPEVDENGNHPRAYAKLGGYHLNLDKVKYSIEDAN